MTREERRAEGQSDRLALYLHVPFCQTKCHYCDFNSYRGLSSLVEPFVAALERDILGWGEETAHPAVGTIFFGGGTPSLLTGPQVTRLLAACRRAFAVAPEAEISLEANPGTVDVQHLATYREAGANRLSFGVQSLHDDELQWLGRRHSAEEARRTYRLARAAGFDNINLDLIFGLPGQSPDRWHATLQGALELGPEHLSCYALTVEEETPLGRAVALGRAREPDSDAQAEMYALTGAALADAGYEHYEISNWARPGRRCRHNLVYWRNQPYLGLGPGAHSCYAGWRFAALKSPRAYIDAIAKTPHPDLPPQGGKVAANRRHLVGADWDPRQASPAVVEAERVARKTDMSDTVILGLRLAEGVSRREFRARYGSGLTQVYGRQIAELGRLGLVELTEDSLRLTERGRPLGNEAFVRFLPD